jgi:RNA polymerase sigma factor (TIGR02999 family)
MMHSSDLPIRFADAYRDLHSFAETRLARWLTKQTLSGTDVVHEAYLRMASRRSGWNSRAHFQAAAVQAMRHVVVDHARKRGLRSGGHADGAAVATPDAPEGGLERLLELESVIERLREHSPRAAEVVLLRFYGGMPESETSMALSLSVRTVRREWAYAKAWLSRELTRADGELPTLPNSRREGVH